ncbi:MAG: hypothetical protein IJ131_00495 [Eggerthellaceae bacterium]|nr:hypothetical protein [Eggerthellaceae bacterium]
MSQTNSCLIIDFGNAAALYDLRTSLAESFVSGRAEQAFEDVANPANPVRILSHVARLRSHMNILLCESLTTFAHVRRLMKNNGQRRFFGTRIDAVAFGANAAFAQPWGLMELERSLGDADGVCYTALGGAYRPRVTYLYWGDICRSSVMEILDVYRANSGRTIRPFAPAYRYMLDLAFGRNLPATPEAPANSFLLRLERYFTPMQRSTYRMVLANQQRIPQGIVTERRLRKLSRVAC